jgi:hypothetical protein
MMTYYKEILAKQLLPNAVDHVYALIVQNNVNLIITRKRRSKLGDFRPAFHDRPHRISVNHDLNPYSFLITFLHELAHQRIWISSKKRVKPHGEQWQNEFQNLLNPFLVPEMFPAEILDNLLKADKKLFASSGADHVLLRMLKNYDTHEETTYLEQLPEHSHFKLPDGRTFKRMQKRRKNYLCFCLTNGRKYIFNPLTEVIPSEEP